MTNFFEHQERARRNTRVLVFLMVLAVFGLALSIYLLIMLVVTRDPAVVITRLDAQLLGSCLWTTGVVVLLSSATRVASLRGGGAGIAEMLGGHLVSGNPRDGLEKRLLDVVEEMAIASGIPVPQVFVLEQEAGINAFAAGFTPADAVIAVTRGGLEKLTRSELQGVVAHEVSHVLNGDIKLNIRLMGIVYGILSIALMGRFLMRTASQSRVSFSSSQGPRDASAGGIVFVFGASVFAIGLLGELFGKLIKAAVSRQRELLADASAVQFTRDPQGLAGALKKIGGYWAGAGLSSEHADEASHFFFGDIHAWHFWSHLFATHPRLEERIVLIEPSFRGEFPEVGPEIAQPEDLPVIQLAASAAQPATHAGGVASAPRSIVSQVGTTSARAIDRGKRSIAALPPQLRAAAHSPFCACAVAYALLLSDDPRVRDEQLAQIETRVGAELRSETLRMLAQVQGVARRERFALLALLGPSLRGLSGAQRAVFIRAVQALIDTDRSVSIFEYVVAQTLRARLHDSREARQRARVRHRSLGDVAAEIQLLLSLLAHAGDFDGSEASTAFSAGVARLPGVQLTLLPPSQRLLSGLGAALEELVALAPRLSAQIIDACAHTVLADGRVADDEETLLRAVCDALGSPLPPLDLTPDPRPSAR